MRNEDDPTKMTEQKALELLSRITISHSHPFHISEELEPEVTHEECPTALNWAALAAEYAVEVGYRCGCGRPLTLRRGVILQSTPDSFPVQGYAERRGVFLVCRCGKVHSARKVLDIDRYAPRIPRSLLSHARGLICRVVDAFENPKPSS